jgi:putative permease
MSRLALNTLIVLAVLTGMYLLWQLRGAALLFIGSLALAAALRPAISWLMRRRVPRSLAIGGVYVLVFGALAVIALCTCGPALREIQLLADDFVNAYQTIFDEWRDGSHLQRAIAARLPAPDDFFATMAGGPGAALLQTALGATFNLLALSIDLVIVLFLSVYWSMDQIHFERLWLSLLRLERRASARQLWRSVEREVGAYVRSETVQCLAAGLLLWIGYRALGETYPLLLAVVGAATWLIPWIGALLAGTAVVAISLPRLVLEMPANASIVSLSLAYTLLVLLALQLFVEPRFFNRRRYNSLITAVVIFGMAEVAGLMGILVGAPLAAAMQIAGGQWMRMRLETAGNGASSLAYDVRMATLRGELAASKRSGPEVASLVDRLAVIVEQADEVLDGHCP